VVHAAVDEETLLPAPALGKTGSSLHAHALTAAAAAAAAASRTQSQASVDVTSLTSPL